MLVLHAQLEAANVLRVRGSAQAWQGRRFTDLHVTHVLHVDLKGCKCFLALLHHKRAPFLPLDMNMTSVRSVCQEVLELDAVKGFLADPAITQQSVIDFSSHVSHASLRLSACLMYSELPKPLGLAQAPPPVPKAMPSRGAIL